MIAPVAVATLPTRLGDFRVVAFTGDPQGKEHLALVRGNVRGRSRVPVRVHSECLTGDVLGSLRCDCRQQLTASLENLGKLPFGALLYLRQEGRGIGLTNKIKAYALQDLGHDTIEANHLLGFGDDHRDYRMAAEMLLALGIRSVNLITNNPAKIRGLREHGTQVVGRIPVVVPPNPHNSRYLATKQKRAGHWLSPLTPEGVGELPQVIHLHKDTTLDFLDHPASTVHDGPCGRMLEGHVSAVTGLGGQHDRTNETHTSYALPVPHRNRDAGPHHLDSGNCTRRMRG